MKYVIDIWQYGDWKPVASYIKKDEALDALDELQRDDPDNKYRYRSVRQKTRKESYNEVRNIKLHLPE